MYIFRTLFWGTLYIIIALIVGPWLTMLFDESFPAISLGSFRYVGSTVWILAMLFALFSAVYLLMPGRSCPAPYEAGGSFSVSGPYRYMRNPLMLAVVIALWGEAVYLERLALLIYAFVFTWATHFWVLFFEEPALRKRLKTTYLDYQKAVPRWFPRLRGYKD